MKHSHLFVPRAYTFTIPLPNSICGHIDTDNLATLGWGFTIPGQRLTTAGIQLAVGITNRRLWQMYPITTVLVSVQPTFPNLQFVYLKSNSQQVFSTYPDSSTTPFNNKPTRITEKNFTKITFKSHSHPYSKKETSGN